jgi:hypothetical protein
VKVGGIEIQLCVECEAKLRQAECANRQRPRRRAFRAWQMIERRCMNRDGRNPSYASVELRLTKDAFLVWAIPAFTAYYEQHPEVLQSHDPRDWPSVDRIRGDGHYEAGNLQILAMGENARLNGQHRHVSAPDGMAWCSTHRQYHPRGAFARHAARYNGLQKHCKQAEHLRRGRGEQMGVRGEANHQVKLTLIEGLAIRQAYQAGGVLMRELAARYGVSKAHIGDIVHGRNRWLALNERMPALLTPRPASI